VKEFFPEEVDLKTGTLVVVAHLTNESKVQTIHISRSSTLRYPSYDPLAGCHVELCSENGENRIFGETRPGEYSCFLEADILREDQSYCLFFISPDGKRYESDFELLSPAPSIDSVYFQLQAQAASDPGEWEEGIRFFMDYNFDSERSRYMRWQLIETYELHDPEYDASIFNVDRVMRELPDSSSWRTCWITKEVQQIFTRDCGNLEGNFYRQMPLHFVGERSRKLDHRYSLLVRQLSLSKSAFWYWDQLAKNVQSKGIHYDLQPAMTPGNICCLDEEGEIVIGYFSISGCIEKRIFVDEVPGLKIRKNPSFCEIGEYPPFLFLFPPERLPVYLARARVDGKIKTGQVKKECVDCRDYPGSSHIRPDYW
jgi:hypothetical protein